MEILVDQILGERYQIQSLLGRQTGRRTFLARDLQTERSVVLKLLLFGPDFTWDDLKLFEREAEVLKSLDLPTIPKYLDCFDADTELGTGFVLVQTYIEAKSLQNWLNAGRTFSEGDLISIATQLLTILDYLHNRQPAVIHRDIKPSNILLGDRSGNSPGEVYLVDFASVKTAANISTITGYMPPEQLSGETIPASDLYALGATIIYLATGQHYSELLHRDIQILFEDRVNLSSQMTKWLQSMTDQQAKAEAESTRSLKGGACVSLFGQDLDISLPPRGSDPVSHIIWISIAISYNSVGLFLLFIGFLNFNPIGWLMIVAIPFLLAGLLFIWQTIFDLFGTRRLRIDESKISLSLEICGFRCFPAQTAARQHIDRIEIAPLSHTKDSDGVLVTVPPHLNIWARKKKFSLINFKLTESEQEWLAHELTEWLDLPAPVKLQIQKREEKISSSLYPRY